MIRAANNNDKRMGIAPVACVIAFSLAGAFGATFYDGILFGEKVPVVGMDVRLVRVQAPELATRMISVSKYDCVVKGTDGNRIVVERGKTVDTDGLTITAHTHFCTVSGNAPLVEFVMPKDGVKVSEGVTCGFNSGDSVRPALYVGCGVLVDFQNQVIGYTRKPNGWLNFKVN